MRKQYAVVAMHGSNMVGSHASNFLKGGFNKLDYHDHFNLNSMLVLCVLVSFLQTNLYISMWLKTCC